MDNNIFKQHLTECLNMLPDGMVNTQSVIRWALQHKPNLEVIIPRWVEIMKQDIMAMGTEGAMGVFDKKGFEQAVISAVMESKLIGGGIDPAMLAAMLNDGANGG